VLHGFGAAALPEFGKASRATDETRAAVVEMAVRTRAFLDAHLTGIR
jgi:hypothetical protein